MTRPYQEVGKTLAFRTVELVRALQLVFDSLQHLRRGEIRHLITLSSQLRALLTERSPHADPLLLHIATKFQRNLRLYCMPDVNDPKFPESVRDKLVLRVAGFPFTAERQFPDQFELSFPELLDLQIILFRGNRYTVRDLIEWYANKAGGAHYSRKLPQDFADLLELPFLKENLIINTLVQIGDATLTAGRELLKSVVDLEIHALLCLPAQNGENLSDLSVLFDARYEASSMRLTLAVNKLFIPIFTVSGLQGVVAQVKSDRLINWSEPRYLYAALTIQNDLSTRLELVVDGEVVGRNDVKEPLFVLSDPLNYNYFHNRAVDGPPQQFSFAFGQLVMIGNDVSPLDRAKLMLFMSRKRDNPELPVVLYTPESYAQAAKGTTNLSMTGTVRHVKVSEVLSGTPDVVEESYAVDNTAV